MNHLDDDHREKIEVSKDHRYLRFGNNKQYPSNKEVTIPIRIGELVSNIKVSIVNANIPLLLGAQDMKNLEFTLDFKNCHKSPLDF